MRLNLHYLWAKWVQKSDIYAEMLKQMPVDFQEVVNEIIEEERVGQKKVTQSSSLFIMEKGCGE